jgi:hypothetical protein
MIEREKGKDHEIVKEKALGQWENMLLSRKGKEEDGNVQKETT